MSGIPHLGEDDWAGVTDWADHWWAVDEHFELTRLVNVRLGFRLPDGTEQRSAAPMESRASATRGRYKSYRCAISHMVLYLPFESLGDSECRFQEVFADDLAEGTTQSSSEPEACSG